MLEQTGRALQVAHAAGLVHRDVKPGNILVDRNGNAFLGDFGMATLPEDQPEQVVRGGTPGFMAPEQARGEAVGPAADQYALARTIVEILVGGSDGADVDDAIAMLPAQAAPLAGVLRVATRNDPNDRWRTMDEFVARLQAEPLPEVPPAVRLAPERRVLSPFAWAAHAHAVDEPAPAIGRAQFRLSDLDVQSHINHDAVAQFRAATGYADFGWSLYARTDRLGPIGASTPARASELVVMLHGWAGTRAVWHDLALAVCRDNADAIVLVPDVHGFGESRFAAPTRAQLEPEPLGRAVLSWLSLLGLRDFPGVLVGHSMSGLALVALDSAELGARLQRIALTPAIMEVVPLQRAFGRVGATLLALGARNRLFRRLCGWISGSRIFAPPGLPTAELAAMKRAILDAPLAIIAVMLRNVLGARLRPTALRGVELVFGDRDPTHPRTAQDRAIREFGGDLDRVHRMGSGGHHPHLPVVDHPEHSARNQDELVRIIGSILLASTEGAVASTLAV
jgi:serine/threonine-protein kinase